MYKHIDLVFHLLFLNFLVQFCVLIQPISYDVNDNFIYDFRAPTIDVTIDVDEANPLPGAESLAVTISKPIFLGFITFKTAFARSNFPLYSKSKNLAFIFNTVSMS